MVRVTLYQVHLRTSLPAESGFFMSKILAKQALHKLRLFFKAHSKDRATRYEVDDIFQQLLDLLDTF